MANQKSIIEIEAEFRKMLPRIKAWHKVLDSLDFWAQWNLVTNSDKILEAAV